MAMPKIAKMRFYKRPAQSAKMRLYKRPAQSAIEAKKRPAIQEPSATLKDKIAQWMLTHAGQPPRRTSEDDAERKLAKEWSYIRKDLQHFDEATEKQLSELRAQHTLSNSKHTLQEYAAYVEKHGRLPPENRSTPADGLPRRFHMLKKCSTG